MKQTHKIISLIMLSSIAKLASAGTDFYISINNNTDMNLTMQNVQTSCWYQKDFQNGVQINARNQATLHTEDKSSSSGGDFCGTSHRHMTFDLVGAHGVKYSSYIVTIRNSGPNEYYWGHDYKGRETIRDNDLGGPYQGDPTRFTIDVFNKLCNTSKSRYVACIFPDN